MQNQHIIQSTNQKIKHLIIGQGIAGTLLSFRLMQAGEDFLIIDKNESHTASHIAGALINPVTGKRIVKSWLIDELIPEARKIYQDLEKLLDIPIIKPATIHRYFINPEDVQFYEERKDFPELQPFLKPLPENEETLFLNERGGISISNAYRIDSKNLINKYRAYLQKIGKIHFTEFDYSKLEIKDTGIQYEEIEAENIIFCEGAAAVKNPFFNYVPFNLNKGERMLLSMPDLPKDKVYKKGLFIYHLENGQYYFGSANSWNFEDDSPSQHTYDIFMQKIQKMTALPFEIIDHKGGIKPSIKDRRPVLGVHPKYSNLYIFNGMGTKGFSLAPYFSKMMFSFLLKEKALMKEVDLGRFEK
ncbi:MAG: FAD-binding oxidoreductase [Chitinophagales bacterium]